MNIKKLVQGLHVVWHIVCTSLTVMPILQILSFNGYLLRYYCMPGTVVDARDVVMSKKDKIPVLI